MNARPTGILDLAATVKMRDIVWLGHHVVQRGMGVVFDLPVWLRQAVDARTSNNEFLDRAHGCITSFGKSLDERYLAFLDFGKAKATKDIKSTHIQRTFRPPIPGRAAMALQGTCVSVVESWPRPRSPSSQDEGFMRRKKAKRGVYD